MNKEKEQVWQRLSTLPDPLLATLLKDAGNLTVSKRYILQQFLGYTADYVDKFLDGYSSGRQD